MVNKLSSLRARLIIVLICIGAFFLVAFFLLQFQLTQFNKNVNEKLNNINSLLEAIDEMRSSLSIATNEVSYALAIDDIEKLEAVRASEADFNSEVIDYDIYSKALLYGSESKKFKEVDGGLIYTQWKRKKLDKSIIYQLEDKQAVIIRDTLDEFNSFVKISQKLFALKKEQLRYKEIKDGEKAQAVEAKIKPLQVQLESIKEKVTKDVGNLTKEVTLGIRQSSENIGAFSSQIRNLSFIYFFIASLISIIIGFLFVERFILIPIKNLSFAAREIFEGGTIHKAKVFYRDEIGILASVFNQMVDKLNASKESLEQKVQEKTLQLSQNIMDLESAKKAMLNIMQDLQAEKEKINEQKSILDSILSNLPVGVSLALPSGRTIMINESGIRLLGKGTDPNITKDNFTEIYRLCNQDGNPYPPGETPFFIALKEGRANTKDDIVAYKPDTTTIALRATSVPIKNTKGQIISIVSVFEDITHEKDVDRMKTEFISLASHQLRTPLSAIKWFSEMLMGGDAGELNTEQKDFAKNITDSTKRMIDLVNSLLNISRIESGRIIVDPQPTNLKELLNDIVKELQVKIYQRHQNLVVSVHDDLPIINLDPRLIRQVYMNFLTNAIKYSPVGGDISVFVSRKDNDIISQVTDSGYGIPKAEQPKLFQKFFRATNIVKIETDGTGLGLYLIKAIIESSKGKVWFQSEEGKGTTFWFSLPITGMIAKQGEVTLDT